jgi:hypothetical protein
LKKLYFFRFEGILTYFAGLWNGCLMDQRMDPVNLDKLGGIGKRAFNHAATEKRKALVKPGRGKTPAAVPTVKLTTVPGAEFFIWNEASHLVTQRNSADPWYQLFFDCHTAVDGFAKRAALLIASVSE